VTVHTVRSLAELVGGVVLGDGADAVITGVNNLKAASPAEIAFLGSAKYRPVAEASRAGAILAAPDDAAQLAGTRIQVAKPNDAFDRIAKLFAPPPVRYEPGVHPTAVVAPDAVLGPGVSIQPHVVIGARARIGAGTIIGASTFIGEECTIGENCMIYPLVFIRERCVIGSRVILGSCVVVGSDGFGYEFKDGRHVRIAHSGIVQIDDDVEIGPACTIDRARIGKTHIGEGTKINNLVMIGHNVTIGAHSIIVSQTGISGSTSVGRGVVLAGQVGLAGHITVGDRATVTAQSGITKDVPAGAVLSGRHARPLREALKLEALVGRLPELLDRIKALEEKIKSLE
jgi:UDP-3-O-[3-hydroxymyristoyl] glucosamine N-acyltransferase